MAIPPIRVMLVDDHPLLRLGVRAYLTSRSIEVVAEAADAKDALRKAKALGPDVIVLDVNMPVMDGGKLALRLRSLLAGTKLVAFSMHSGREYVDRMKRCGVHGYVTKDRPTAELLEAIRSVFAGRTHFPKGGSA